MPKAPAGLYTITRADQHAALASPPRQEIIDLLSATGPQSIAEIAVLLGRSPHSLYHHVRALLEVELLLKSGVRKKGRRDEVLYSAPGRRIRVRIDLDSPVFVRNMRRHLAAMLRITERDYRRRLERPREVRTIPSVNFAIGRVKGRLTEAQMREAHRLMTQLWSLLTDHPGQTEGTLHALTMVLVPLRDPPASKAKGRDKKNA